MTTPPPRTIVFVYGSLLREEPNAYLLSSAHFIRATHTAARYRLVSLGAFPGLLEGGTTAVAGETYAVDARTLAALDRLESHPKFYRRTAIELADGTPAEAYVLPAERYGDHADIAGGDWRARHHGVCDPSSDVPEES